LIADGAARGRASHDVRPIRHGAGAELKEEGKATEMSHYAEVTLKITGEAEAIVRALCEMEWKTGKLARESVEVHTERKNLEGYHGDMREQKAHIIIRRQHVGGSSNDIGFEKKSDGSWVAHVSDFDKSFYNTEWQKRLLSKWAVQRAGMEAEKHGYKWNVEYATENKWNPTLGCEVSQAYAYVRVCR
jgi:hypothetical protein